ncbi:hypothetical protein [Actinophytocola gossypii]|uniref:DUF202 domain-containing protein n=1 Tax=Actinophytocola gossypii TaxID=2812003 RepID=A0ABT2JC05_9PSEU|nr:hypothetical protein [Actinophytocola gossypii]MCT2584995.1 hypothetical protein [Actinophytocola gossypii]
MALVATMGPNQRRSMKRTRQHYSSSEGTRRKWTSRMRRSSDSNNRRLLTLTVIANFCTCTSMVVSLLSSWSDNVGINVFRLLWAGISFTLLVIALVLAHRVRRSGGDRTVE